jgi:hypothetical protein
VILRERYDRLQRLMIGELVLTVNSTTVAIESVWTGMDRNGLQESRIDDNRRGRGGMKYNVARGMRGGMANIHWSVQEATRRVEVEIFAVFLCKLI